MSEQTASNERTERPTPKRLLDARKNGQVPRSRELNTVVIVLAGGFGMVGFGGWMMGRLETLTSNALSRSDMSMIDPGEIPNVLGDAVFDGLQLLAPLLLVLMCATVAGPALMGGFIFSAEAARPKFNRLDPVAGLKRIFSVQGFVELVKTLLKFAVLTGIAIVLLWSIAPQLLALAFGDVERSLVDAASMIRTSFMVLAGGLVLIAAIDAPFQLWSHLKRLRMTRQEIREELKETEGSPEVKARIRRLQQEAARRRMMDDVPHADVVLTNPTHYAVALRYSDHTNRAPRVVAKGRDLVAARIRDLAAEHDVPVCAAPPLARAIYFSTRIGEEIPAALYLAVARVLAWVFQVRASRQTAAAAPPFPEDLPVPDELLKRARTDA